MIWLVRFNLSYYLKSYQWIVPTVSTALFFMLYYRLQNANVWTHYYGASLAIFAFANWQSVNILNCENTIQRHITLLHAASPNCYYRAKLLSVFLFLLFQCFILSACPIIFHLFQRPLRLGEFFFAVFFLWYNGILGAATGAFFSDQIFSAKYTGTPIHVFFVLLAITPLQQLYTGAPFRHFFAYLLPPIHFLSRKFYQMQNDLWAFDKIFLHYWAYASIYLLILNILYRIILRKQMKMS